MTDVLRLTRLLREELALQNRHCRLLEAQQRALIACDRDRFCGLQGEYAALVERLEAQCETRTALLRDADGQPATVTGLVSMLPEGKRPLLLALRDDLGRVLEQAQDLCRRNQTLIQNELNFMAFSLDLFVEAGRRADATYGGGCRMRRKLLDRTA